MSSQTGQVPSIPTRGGGTIPQLGFGVFQVPPEETTEVVLRALETGYRHIDTAAAYRNEAGVGTAVKDSGLGRGEVYMTTKCWNENQGYDEARRALKRASRHATDDPLVLTNLGVLGLRPDLAQARSWCDRLIVGLNSDRSVRGLKGEGRPVNDLEARALVLAGLASVDLVVPFDAETPIELIKMARPDVLVKGGDYAVEVAFDSGPL